MKKTGFVVKYYDNIHPTQVEASNICIRCGKEFTVENPCWNDNGCDIDITIHVDGVCKACAAADAKKTKKELFGEARASFYDAAVTLLNAWQAAEAEVGESLFTHDYPFDEGGFEEVVYKIGKWVDQDPFVDEGPKAWEIEDNNDELPEQEEPTVD